MDFSGVISFIPFLLGVMAAASSGAIFKPGEWYDGLNKPSWNPPDWLFPVAWSVLYLMIAVSGWRVWTYGDDHAIVLPLSVFVIQLGLNAAWSGLFFGLRRMDLAFFELVALWASIVAMIVLFHPIDQIAAWLLVPYLVWVSFAGVLNATVWRLNPDRQGTATASD